VGGDEVTRRRSENKRKQIDVFVNFVKKDREIQELFYLSIVRVSFPHVLPSIGLLKLPLDFGHDFR
jgi:hypothetical protein